MKILLLLLLSAAILRVIIFNNEYQNKLQYRMELSTPLSSFLRLREGLLLDSLENTTAYAGWAFHQPPLVLCFFKWILEWPPAVLYSVFIMADCIAAVLLYQTASIIFATNREQFIRPYQKSLIAVAPKLAAAIYLFHPYSWLATGALSLTVFNNLAVVAALYFAIRGKEFDAALALALATYLSLFPVMLLLPLTLLLRPAKFRLWFCFAMCLAILLAASYAVQGGSWLFLEKVYLFTLLVQDLTPNIGIFWYFFLEMFKHYRLLFLCALHLHTVSYLVPLYLRLKQRPITVFIAVAGIISTFKPYPDVADIALCMALLPLLLTWLPKVQFGFILVNTQLYISALSPILWYMWVQSGTGNSNFYYALTLVQAIAAGWLVSNLLSAILEHDYRRKHNLPLE